MIDITDLGKPTQDKQLPTLPTLDKNNYIVSNTNKYNGTIISNILIKHVEAVIIFILW